jgi:hypothetical protein
VRVYDPGRGALRFRRERYRYMSPGRYLEGDLLLVIDQVSLLSVVSCDIFRRNLAYISQFTASPSHLVRKPAPKGTWNLQNIGLQDS